MKVKYPLRVMQIHNAYQLAGGEDMVVEAERNLLSSFGHDVFSYIINNDGINSVYEKIKSALFVHYSDASKEAIKSEIRKFQPDVVHVHNFFPLITPSVYDACIESNVPVVQTLHNYRAICPGALLMRGGEVCEKCVEGSPYQSVLHGCYRDSKLGTLALAHMVHYHTKSGTWNTKVNQFIALTNFAKLKYIQGGFPSSKISIKPNFIDLNDFEESGVKEDKAFFVGRISEEKGVSILLDAWKEIPLQLDIAGVGPLLSKYSSVNRQNVHFLGSQQKTDVFHLMKTSKFMIMPSIWYEGFPMVLVEAFAHGLPVICSRLGGMAEIVEDGVTGLHFDAGSSDDLAKKVMWAIDNPDEIKIMGKNARQTYEEKYTVEVNYRQLLDIYEKVVVDNEEKKVEES